MEEVFLKLTREKDEFKTKMYILFLRHFYLTLKVLFQDFRSYLLANNTNNSLGFYFKIFSIYSDYYNTTWIILTCAILYDIAF